MARGRYNSVTCATIGCALVAGGLAGCALNRAASRQVTTALDRLESQGAADGAAYGAASWKAGEAPTETVPTVESPEAPAPASLRDYLVVALRENPEILAAAETARAVAARVPQVTALPDPMVLTKTLPEPVRTAEGDNFFVLGIQQRFPVPGKLELAGRIALQEVQIALENLQATRLRIIADVKRAYFRIYVIDQTIGIDRANQDLLRGLIDVARSQSAVGQGTQGDVLRAQVELSSLESDIIELQQQRASTVARLNRLLSRPPNTPVPAAEPFDLRRVDAAVERLFEKANDASPDLQRLREQIERDRRAVELAQLAWWPDFTVGFEWMYLEGREAFRPRPDPQTGRRPAVSRMSEEGNDNWAITFGFNLPIWVERIGGGIEEARRRLLASQHHYTAEKDRVYAEIEDALARVRAQQELAVLFRDTIIPQAQQAYEVSRAAYTAGATDFLFVIDNWQKWLTFSVQFHRALGELEGSIADLEQAIGLNLGEVETNE